MLTPDDVAYIEKGFRRLEELCAERDMTPSELTDLRARRLLPCPTYVLDDGTEMVPEDYFDLLNVAKDPNRIPEQFAQELRDHAGGKLERALRREVHALDVLEREFAPFDRVRWGPVSRDRLITAVRARYPEVFDAADHLPGDVQLAHQSR
jgi:hypothetical protein